MGPYRGRRNQHCWESSRQGTVSRNMSSTLWLNLGSCSQGRAVQSEYLRRRKGAWTLLWKHQEQIQIKYWATGHTFVHCNVKVLYFAYCQRKIVIQQGRRGGINHEMVLPSALLDPITLFTAQSLAYLLGVPHMKQWRPWSSFLRKGHFLWEEAEDANTWNSVVQI